MVKDTTKAIATETAQRAVEKVLKPEMKDKVAKAETNGANEPGQVNNKKGGFFHKLFHRKDKGNGQNNDGVQMASR